MGKYLTSLYKFEPATITRGREYFKEGRVHFLQVTPTRVNACVEGSEEYHVHAQFANDGELLSSSCDCPCQFPCKHVVALLFALDDRTPSLATLSSGAASVEEFNEAFQKALAEKDGNAFALAASRLSLSFGPFPKADQERLLRQFLDHLGDFGEESWVFHPRFELRGMGPIKKIKPGDEFLIAPLQFEHRLKAFFRGLNQLGGRGPFESGDLR
jgi:hypothetical protein